MLRQVGLVFAALVAAVCAHAAPVRVVAAENFYGDIARQIGGGDVAVTSILSNPDQDPHLFEASPSVARDLSAARVVIMNGADYDPWMPRLLDAARAPDRRVIVVADLISRKPGENPHIWYDPATMPALAQALADDLAALDPAHAGDFRQRQQRFRASLDPIQEKIAALRARLAGTPVTATEPVFGDMLAALGMQVRNMPFQIAVMNGTEPSASDIAVFETDLRTHRVKLLVYDRQASGPVAERMQAVAKDSGIPVLGTTETEPAGKTWQQWMLDDLDAIARALPG